MKTEIEYRRYACMCTVPDCAPNHPNEPIGFAFIDREVKPTREDLDVIRRFLQKFHKPKTLAESCRDRDRDAMRKKRRVQ